MTECRLRITHSRKTVLAAQARKYLRNTAWLRQTVPHRRDARAATAWLRQTVPPVVPRGQWVNRLGRPRGRAAWFWVLLGVWLVGCRASEGKPDADSDDREAVIYCSVDSEFAEPILAEFEKRSGIKVHRQFDTEAGKTTGLVNKLLLEREAPRADVWWSGEIFGTLQLARAGILAPYRPATAEDIPERYRDACGLWTAFGLRGRVIAYDPTRTKAEELPKRWADMTDPKYKGRFALADPRFGTTRGHMATLLALWGEPAMREFYEGLRRNEYQRAAGNSHVVLMLTRGIVDFAATDTDDAFVAQERGDDVAMVAPDLDAPDGSRKTPGTVWIPCSAAMVRGAPHSEAAQALLDYLASAEIEEKLQASSSKNVPVRRELRAKLGPGAASDASDGSELRSFAVAPADVDYAAAAAALAESDRLVSEVLLK